MLVVGYTILFFLFTIGMVFAQYIFWKKTGRTFWRAMIPQDIRHKVLPEDTFRMNAWMALEEWTAILLFFSYLTLPVIALDFMGFLKIFN